MNGYLITVLLNTLEIDSSMKENKQLDSDKLTIGYADFVSRYVLDKIWVDKLEWQYLDSKTENRPAIIFLHGTRGNPYIFWNQFNELKDDFRLILIKLPLIHDTKEICTGLMSICQHLEAFQISLLGTSIGGYIAQWFAYYYPANVKELIICNSVIDGENIDNPSRLFSEYILPIIPNVLIQKSLQRRVKQSLPHYNILEKYIYDNIVSKISAREFSERALTFHKCGRVPALTLPDKNITIIYCSDDPYISKTAQKAVLLKYPASNTCCLNTGHHFPYVVRPKIFNMEILKIFEGLH